MFQDIERAFTHNYPDELKQKLEERRAKAEVLLPTQQPRNYFSAPPLILSRHPKIPVAADSIKIDVNPKYGRLIVATRNIEVGETISVEESYCHCISPTSEESRYRHCHYCLDLCFNPIPCPNCTVALYCGEECLKRDFADYHKYECTFIPYWHSNAAFFIKIAVQGLKEQEAATVQRDESIYYSDRFKEISQLMTHDEYETPNRVLTGVLNSCYAYHTLKNNDNFQTDFVFKNIDNKLKLLLYTAYKICDFNPFSVLKVAHKFNDREDFITVGTSIYSFTSLFNHSCAPNCEVYHCGTVLVTKAIGKINKGEQLTISYG